MVQRLLLFDIVLSIDKQGHGKTHPPLHFSQWVPPVMNCCLNPAEAPHTPVLQKASACVPESVCVCVFECTHPFPKPRRLVRANSRGSQTSRSAFNRSQHRSLLFFKIFFISSRIQPPTRTPHIHLFSPAPPGSAGLHLCVCVCVLTSSFHQL